MPNITITTTTNSIKVDFGDYASTIGCSKGTWLKSQIIKMCLVSSNDAVEIKVIGGDQWFVSYAGTTGTLIIDSIDGVAPTSNADLYTKLIAMVA